MSADWRTTKRAQEDALTSRLLNSKTRTIGLNKGDLDAQVEEKAAGRRAERAADVAYAEHVKYVHGLGEAVDMQAERERLDEDQLHRAYLKAQKAAAHMTDTADLNDPHAVRKQKVLTEEERRGAGASSLLHFAGHELEDDARANPHRFREVLIADNDGLLRDAADQRARQAAQDRAYAEMSKGIQKAAEGIEAEWETNRRLEARRVGLDNKTLARDGRNARAREAAESLAGDVSHNTVSANSALMTESREACYNVTNPSRPRPDHFKGMSKEEIIAIRREQYDQREELLAKRKAEKASDGAYLAAMRRTMTAADDADKVAAQEEADAKRQYFLDLKRQQREDRARKAAAKAEEKKMYKPMDEGLLAGFSRSLR